MYRPPHLADQIFSDTVSRLLEEMTSEYKNIIIMGDLNYDLIHRNNNVQQSAYHYELVQPDKFSKKSNLFCEIATESS